MADDDANTPPTLDYARPRGPRWPRVAAVWRAVVELGPWFPRPSVFTFVLAALLAAATVWLAATPPAWTEVTTYPAPDLPVHRDSLQEGVLSDGTLLCLSPTGTLDALDVWTGRPTRTFPLGPGTPFTARLSPDRRHILVATDQGLRVIDVASGRVVAGHRSGTGDGFFPPDFPWSAFGPVALSPGARQLTTAGSESALSVWNLTGPRATLETDGSGRVKTGAIGDAAAFSPLGDRLLLWDYHGYALLDITGLREIAAARSHSTDDVPPAFTPDGLRFLAVRGNQVVAYDAATGAERYAVDVGGWDALLLSLSPDGRRFVAGGRVTVCDTETGRPLARLPGYGGPGPPAWSADGRRVVLVRGVGDEPAVMDADTGRHLANLALPRKRWNRVPPVLSLIAAPDATRVAGLTADGQMRVWQRTGTESPYGAVATPAFAAMGVLAVALAVSLCRDALATRRRRADSSASPLGRLRGMTAAVLVAAAVPGLLLPLAWAAVGHRDVYTWWYNGWPAYVFVLHGAAGLGLLMNSTGWRVLGVLLLITGMLGLVSGPMTGDGGNWIIDRAWSPHPLRPAIACVCALLALTALAGLFVVHDPSDEVDGAAR